MDRQLPDAEPFAEAEETLVPPRSRVRLRCDICARKLGKTLTYLEETGDVPEPRQSWLVCEECNAAIKGQMARARVQTPLRLRVAVGIVSTERTPLARRAHRGELSDSAWIKLLFIAFIGGLIAHLMVIVIIAGIAR